MTEFYCGDAMREKFQERNADLPGLRGRGGSCIPLQFAFDGPPDTAAKPCFGLVSKRQAAEFIRKYEWLGDVAPIFRAFGAFWGMHLGGCVCFSYPPSKEAAKGVCGDEYTSSVMWLSRGAETPWAPRYTASQVVSYGLDTRQSLLLSYFRAVPLPATLIMAETNAELKQILIEAKGIDQLFAELNPAIVHQDIDGYGHPRRLLAIKIPEARNGELRAVQVVCPTTGRTYILGVPSTVNTCQQAVASTFGMAPHQYAPDRES